MFLGAEMEAVIVWGHNMSRGPYRMPTAKVDNKKNQIYIKRPKTATARTHTHARTGGATTRLRPIRKINPKRRNKQKKDVSTSTD